MCTSIFSLYDYFFTRPYLLFLRGSKKSNGILNVLSMLNWHIMNKASYIHIYIYIYILRMDIDWYILTIFILNLVHIYHTLKLMLYDKKSNIYLPKILQSFSYCFKFFSIKLFTCKAKCRCKPMFKDCSLRIFSFF